MRNPGWGLYLRYVVSPVWQFKVGSRLPRPLSQEREPGESWIAFYGLAPEVRQPSFLHILLIKAGSHNTSLGLRGGENRLHLLYGSDKVLENYMGWKRSCLWFLLQSTLWTHRKNWFQILYQELMWYYPRKCWLSLWSCGSCFSFFHWLPENSETNMLPSSSQTSWQTSYIIIYLVLIFVFLPLFSFGSNFPHF